MTPRAYTLQLSHRRARVAYLFRFKTEFYDSIPDIHRLTRFFNFRTYGSMRLKTRSSYAYYMHVDSRPLKTYM